jgi:hypothetical protein
VRIAANTASLAHILQEGVEIPIDTLDNLTKNIPDVGLLKMDIEGAEYDVILGAIETIRRCLPVMLISIYHTPKEFFELKPLIDKISQGRYSFLVRQLKFTGQDVGGETELICIPKGVC